MSIEISFDLISYDVEQFNISFHEVVLNINYLLLGSGTQETYSNTGIAIAKGIS